MPRVACADCPARYYFGVSTAPNGEEFYSPLKECPSCQGKNRNQIADLSEDIEWM